MKKLIVLLLIIVIGFAGYKVFKNKDLIRISNPKANDISQSEVIIDNWATYTNSQYGLEFSYPAEMTIEEDMHYYPQSVSFDTPKVALGARFDLNIYDIAKSTNITSLDSIPRLTKPDATREVLSTENITNVNNIPLQIIKGVQYSIKDGKVDKTLKGDTLSIVFMKGQNAYALNWSCWTNTSCFNDEIVSRLADSIKLNK